VPSGVKLARPHAERAQHDAPVVLRPLALIDPATGLRVREHVIVDVGVQRLRVAQHIAQVFAAIDAANAADYAARYKRFETAIDAKLQEWGETMLPFKGANVVAYHDSWPYFAHRFGLTIDTFLEPKPGIPPSPSHLAEVIEKMKAQKSKAIIVEPFQNRKIAEKVAAATGAQVIDAAQFPGALPNATTYIAHMDALVSRFAAALGAQ
jgi:zinc/manganese transport system substrate-binding protein